MDLYSPIHPILGILTAILILCGTVLVGKQCLLRFFGKSDFILSLGIGMILISQLLYILSLKQDAFLWGFLYLLNVFFCDLDFYDF